MNRQKRLLASLFISLFFSTSGTAKPLPGEAWTWEGAQTPESVAYDEASRALYVANVAGDPDKKDGVGWISKLGLDGKVVEAKWVEGFNAPKGIVASQGFLWLSDINELVQVEIATKKIVTKVTVSDSKFLNDVAVGLSGEVYVSDTFTSRVYVYNDAKVSVFAEGDDLESPNGLWIQGPNLIVAAWGRTSDFSTKVPGRLFLLDRATKKKTLVTPKPTGNLDGLAVDGDGNYWVSDWSAGKVFHVTPKGKLDVRLEGVRGAADFAWVSAKKWIVLPRMLENKVTAFDTSRLKAIP